MAEAKAKAKDIATETAEVNAGHLRAFVERIERLEEEKKALADDIKDVYGEAKANGFDTRIMRKIVSIRKQDRDKRIEEETILDLYLAALGNELTKPLQDRDQARVRVGRGGPRLVRAKRAARDHGSDGPAGLNIRLFARDSETPEPSGDRGSLLTFP